MVNGRRHRNVHCAAGVRDRTHHPGRRTYRGSISWSKGLTIGYVPRRLPYIRDVPLSVADFFVLKGGGRAIARDMLSAVGLAADLASERMGDLSSGQFQRVLIAWGLVGDPAVLLFDEPTAGIDVGGEETVYALLARLHRDRNLTMLLVTHDLTVVYEFSSTVLCLNNRAVCQGFARRGVDPGAPAAAVRKRREVLRAQPPVGTGWTRSSSIAVGCSVAPAGGTGR
jgi:zinc transport system ATP-binding protein